MYKITREAIRRLAATETVYFRGMRYYAAHAVSNVTWNESVGQYHAFVQGNNIYGVTVAVDDVGEIQYTCNCPAHVKYQGACKHVVAALLFVSDYQQREDAMEHMGKEDQRAYTIIEYFRKREYRQLTPRYFRLELQITINEPLKAQNAKAFVSLYAGSGKRYKVSNTKKFISDYYHGREIRLGKEFQYISGECAFEPISDGVIRYLTEIYEIQETLGKTYYSNLFNRQELVVSRNMLCKLLTLAAGLQCSLHYCGKVYENLDILCKNPDLSLEIQMDNEILRLQDVKGEPMLAICDDGSILCYQGGLYLPERDFLANLRPFFTAVFGEKSGGGLEFRGENIGNFIEKVLPVIKKTMDITVPDTIKEQYVVEQLVPKLYLDMSRNRQRPVLVAKLIFAYGEYDINPLREDNAINCVLVRDREEEERLIRHLYDLHFTVREEVFTISREEEIYQLMTEYISALTNEFTVFYSKDYKACSLRKTGALSAGIRLNTDVNLLEMELEYGQIPREELQEFFRAIRLKRKYYRLRSGAFIDLLAPDRQLDELRRLLALGEVQDNSTITFSQMAVAEVDELLPHSRRIVREEKYQTLLKDLQRPEETKWVLPEGMEGVLRPYQEVGYRWLSTLAKYGLGGILADDMGLGKTLQTISYIAANPETRTLIVCPTSLAYNWQEEFARFAPAVRTQIVSGTPQERARLLREEKLDVWITTYPLIRKDMSLYKDMEFDAFFLDEAQFIKNPASLGAKAVKSVPAKHRFALTGTPIENTLSELWSVFDFIMPDFFARFRHFSEEYEKPILKEHNQKRLQELQRKIRPFILRRMKADVLPELPDKIETRRMAEMGSKQRKIYESYLSRIQTELAEGEELSEGQGRIQVLAALTRLRQICCHPATFIENYKGGSGKLDLLMEQLPDILAAGHSVIVFSQFTSMLSLIAAELRARDILFFYLAGSTSAEERKREVKEFNRGEVKVFLISLKAGGTGLNLTGADTVIHFDPWWNPAVEEQATDRAYRIGQKKKVQVIKYVMKDSIEEKIYELQKRKKKLSDELIQAGESFMSRLTMEEIRELFAMDET